MIEKQISEHLHQVRLVSWFRQTYKNVRILSIPNGGARSAITGAKMKAEGQSPGALDLFIPDWLLWIELKTITGVLSPAQKDWISYLEGIGHKVIVGYGFEDAKAKILAWQE